MSVLTQYPDNEGESGQAQPCTLHHPRFSFGVASIIIITHTQTHTHTRREEIQRTVEAKH